MFPCLLRQYSVLPNAYASENLWPPEMINRFGSLTDVVCVSPAMFHIDHLPVRKVTTRSMPASPIIFPSPSLTGAPTMHTLMILLSTFYTSYTTIHLCYKTNKKEILPPPVLTQYTKMYTHSKKHSCYTNNTKIQTEGRSFLRRVIVTPFHMLAHCLLCSIRLRCSEMIDRYGS